MTTTTENHDLARLGQVKYGTDKKLEELADQLLGEGVGDNQRSIARDLEKVAYEHGFTSPDELRHYEPRNDWDTHDSVFAIAVDPSDVGAIEPSICAEVDDGNTRAKNRRQQERQALMRHVDDSDNWGSTWEEVPLLGVNEGPRKVCTRCKQSKGLQSFYAQPRNSDGLSSWCKGCQKSINKSGKKTH